METAKLMLDIYKSIVLTIIAVLLFLIYLKLFPSSQSVSIKSLPDVVENAQKSVAQKVVEPPVEQRVSPDPEAQGDRNAMISDMTNIAVLAQKYYRQSGRAGGGGNSFKGWRIPAGMETTNNGKYTAEVSTRLVTLTGHGYKTGDDGSSNVKIVMNLDDSRIISTDVKN